MRDRRDRNSALLQFGHGTEHDTRTARAAAAEQQVASDVQRLAAAAEQLHTLRGRLLTTADHREADCSRQALVVLGLAAAALRTDGGQNLPEGMREVCAAIAELRAAVRGESS